MVNTSVKAGLPPGSLIHVGERRTEGVSASLIRYDLDNFSEEKSLTPADVCALPAYQGVTWVNTDGLGDTEAIRQIGECFGIHSLTLEDILNTQQRPKKEEFDTYLFIVLKMLYLSDGEVNAEQISLVLKDDIVLSFQEQEGDVFDPVRNRIRNKKGRIRSLKASYLLYALIDSIVDGYFIVLESVAEQIENLHEELLENPTTDTLRTIHCLRQDIIFIRKSIWPLREVVSGLERDESGLIGESTLIYYRDVYDHTIQIVESLEGYRDVVSGMLDIYLSTASNRMNEIMKVLTIIATIFIPLSFVAGVYGMNFINMPELAWAWGYPAALLLMFAVASVMLVFFRRKGWL